MTMTRALLLVPIVVIGACASDPPTTTDATATTATRPPAGDAPPPFTAAEIAAATGEGRRYTFVSTSRDEAPVLLTMRFVDVTAAGATVQIDQLDTTLAKKKSTLSSTTPWPGFVAHATYPAAKTTIEEVETRVPWGVVKGPRYVFTDDTSDPWTTVRATFSRDLPGAPVRFDELEGERARHRMILVDHVAAAAPSELAAPDERLLPLGWLVGRWRSEADGIVSEETWFRPVGAAMTGVAITSSATKDVGFEVMQIRADAAGPAYTAWPDGQHETTFAFASADENVARWVNAEHDYPQRITYETNGEKLAATVSALDGQREKRVVFARVAE